MGCGNSSVSVTTTMTMTPRTDAERVRVQLYQTPRQITRILEQFVLDGPFALTTHMLTLQASETLAFDEDRSGKAVSAMQRYTGKALLHLESIEVVTRLGVRYFFSVNGKTATTDVLLFCPVGIRSVNFKRAANTHSDLTLNSYTSHIYFCSL